MSAKEEFIIIVSIIIILIGTVVCLSIVYCAGSVVFQRTMWN